MLNLNWFVKQDPRSPSIEFNRTPIPVDPSQSNNAIEDPRSPTAEVPRTPLEKVTYDYIGIVYVLGLKLKIIKISFV